MPGDHHGFLIDHSGEAIVGPGVPHEGMFFVLAYLELRDLFSVRKVCRSLRDAVNGDPLLWRDICVDRTLSWKLTNDALAQITGRAQAENPRISEICLPGCVHVTADGIVKAVRALADRTDDGPLPLKRLALGGLQNLTAESVGILNSMIKHSEQKQMHRYYGFSRSFTQGNDHHGVIDVDVCPKCEEVSHIFDCTRKECMEKRHHRLLQCRGCLLCIGRCDDCGACIRWDEFGQTFCGDLLCEKCWMQLPKWRFCNRSGCRRNVSHSMMETETGPIYQHCWTESSVLGFRIQRDGIQKWESPDYGDSSFWGPLDNTSIPPKLRSPFRRIAAAESILRLLPVTSYMVSSLHEAHCAEEEMRTNDDVIIPFGKEATDLVEVQNNSDACDHHKTSKASFPDGFLTADESFLASTSSDWTPGNPSDRSSSESDRSGEAIVDSGIPHEGMFFVLAYLELRDLLSVRKVCRSLRDAVNGDLLLWRDICVDRPLSWKLTNDALAQITGRAQGNLRSLTLRSCWMVTDVGLHRVIAENPRISEDGPFTFFLSIFDLLRYYDEDWLESREEFMDCSFLVRKMSLQLLRAISYYWNAEISFSGRLICLPGCVHVTADGIVKAVRTLADRTGDGPLPLKRLALHGLQNLTAEHVGILNSMIKHSQQKQMHRYYGFSHSFAQGNDHHGVIDVDVCPKCEKVSLIFDCTRKECMEKRHHRLLQCRGCSLCIARCDDCGGCLRWDEFGQTFCGDLLCEKCWLQLPKCRFCNRSGCRRNVSHSLMETETGPICQHCSDSIKN
ncbi:F-box protein [Nymphaea thermarum]|nr:F-box protein [Nymphaea thermarum]